MSRLVARIAALEEGDRLRKRGQTRGQIARLRSLQDKREWRPLSEFNEMSRLQGLAEMTAFQAQDGRILIVPKNTVAREDVG